jgi:hypothetical protein
MCNENKTLRNGKNLLSINFNSVYFTVLFDLFSVECCSLFLNDYLEIYMRGYQKLITFFMSL